MGNYYNYLIEVVHCFGGRASVSELHSENRNGFSSFFSGVCFHFPVLHIIAVWF